MKKVAVITSFDEHFRHVVRALQPLNRNVKFIHVDSVRVFRAYSIFDMAIKYAPELWVRSLIYDLPEIDAHLKAWKTDVRIVSEVREPFILWHEDNGEDATKDIFDKLPEAFAKLKSKRNG